MSRAYQRYEDALIAKLRLLEFTESDLGLRYMHGFQESMNSQHVEGERLPEGMLHALQVRTLRDADPVYVSMDMTDVVDHARESFQPEVLLPTDPFVPCGFALLPRPMMLDDAPPTESHPYRSRDGLIPVRALSWMAIHSEDLSQGCFWISHYTHVEDDLEHRPDGMSQEEIEEHHARMSRIAPLTLGHTWQWSWGADPRDAHAGLVEGEDEERSRARANEQASMVQAFWRIASQVVPVQRRVPRQLWRQEGRKHGIEHREVTVITLRRASEVGDEELEESGRHYNVSFLVRGYWAVRHTKQGPRQVWVRPHLKGQGPFQETERAWTFER